MSSGYPTSKYSLDNKLNQAFNEFIRALDKFIAISYLENSEESPELKDLGEKRQVLRSRVIEQLRDCHNIKEKWRIIRELQHSIYEVNLERNFFANKDGIRFPNPIDSYLPEAEFFGDIIISLTENND